MKQIKSTLHFLLIWIIFIVFTYFMLSYVNGTLDVTEIPSDDKGGSIFLSLCGATFVKIIYRKL